MTVKTTTLAVEVLGETEQTLEVEHYALKVLYTEADVATRIAVQYIEVLWGIPGFKVNLGAIASIQANLSLYSDRFLVDDDLCPPNICPPWPTRI